MVYDNIGNIYLSEKKLDKAIPFFEDALQLRRLLNEPKSIASTLNNLAVAYIENKDYKKAIEYLTESVAIFEQLRLTARIELRKYFLNAQIASYHNLILALVKNKEFDKAFHYIELSRAKQLAETIAKDANLTTPLLKDVMREMNDSTMAIVFTAVDNAEIIIYGITKDTVSVVTESKEMFLRNILNDIAIRELVIANSICMKSKITDVFIE
ncbi:MAG: tetratricopeptide repeat protein [Bacteroidales bacterium]|nr:tetratricopeptide repeat protein [Bacteroidales bacterium]